MSDLTPMLQEMAERADATDLLRPHQIRRRGERRRRRFVATTAASVVLGVVAAGMIASVATRDRAAIDPAEGPTPTAPTVDDRLGLVGPPPPGTPPTGPATGELVAAADLYNSGTWVFADGRIINAWRNFGTRDRFQGFVVRQLTPTGVEAMRSFLVDGTSRLTPVSEQEAGELGLFVRDGGRLMHVRDFQGCKNTDRGCPGIADPDWLPASAWEDPTFRPFVPHSYQVCLFTEDRGVSPAEVLPADAVDILLGPESSLADQPTTREVLCREAATPVASELADLLDRAGPPYGRQDTGPDLNLTYDLPSQGVLYFNTVLPDGGTYCNCG